MGRKGISFVLVFMLLLGSIVVLDVTMDITPKVEAITIYVDDDYGSEDATHKMTIQAAVDNATSGDTVFVYNGTYYENVNISKSINLIGINRENTTINGSNTDSCIKVQNTTGVYISEFNLTKGTDGIIIENSTFVNIINNTIYLNSQCGIRISESSYNNLSGNIIQNNSWEGVHIITLSYNNTIRDSIVNGNKWGIHIADYSENNYIINTTVSNNFGHAIRFVGFHPHNNFVLNCNIINNKRSALEVSGSNITIKDCNIISNGWGEFGWSAIHIKLTSNPTIDNKIINTTIQSNRGRAIRLDNNAEAIIINSSIINTIGEDLYLTGTSIGSLLNTSFNKSNVYLDSASIMKVNWYLHINATDSSSNPVQNAIVNIQDYKNGSKNQTYITDVNGYVRWIPNMEYIQQGSDKTYYTPHRITAWNETLLGYTEVNINESKEVNIVLDTPYYEVPLSAGWNLISLPLVQSDTSISTVLSSIAGNWNVAWWYNASGGTWHSTNGDLTDINHSMGFWIHMKTADTLIVTGTIPNTTSIQLYQGWNLVGNPSFCIHGIDDILSSIATKYTAVQQYDSWDSGNPWKHYHINKPQNLNDLAYITSGRGYWLYVKEDCVWEVSNF
jgi:parallel beta-helix repeat protein